MDLHLHRVHFLVVVVVVVGVIVRNNRQYVSIAVHRFRVGDVLYNYDVLRDAGISLATTLSRYV